MSIDLNNVTTMPTKPVERKTRTITLTNRAPIKIAEDDWPVIAQGVVNDPDNGAPWHWSIELRVRKQLHIGRIIIHAKYDYYDETCEDGQVVRVGRIVEGRGGVLDVMSNDLWKGITEVGEELRRRILLERHHKWVTEAVDACFANLPPLNGY